MKRILGILSVLLIIAVGFTNEAKSFTINYGGGVVKTELVATVSIDDDVGLVQEYLAIFYPSLEFNGESVIIKEDVGGSIISNDAKIPDQDNLYSSTIVSKIYKLNKNTFGGERTSLVKHKYRLASNDEVKDVNLKVDVGKTFTSSRNTLNEYARIT